MCLPLVAVRTARLCWRLDVLISCLGLVDSPVILKELFHLGNAQSVPHTFADTDQGYCMSLFLMNDGLCDEGCNSCGVYDWNRSHIKDKGSILFGSNQRLKFFNARKPQRTGKAQHSPLVRGAVNLFDVERLLGH